MSGRLSLQAILLAGATACGQLLMVLVLSSVGRQVGPAQLGVIAISISIGMVAAGLIDFGANSFWLRELSSGRLSRYDFSRRSGTKLVVGFTISLIISVVFPLSGPILSRHWGAGLICASVVLSQTLQVAVRAERRNVHLSVLTMLERAALASSFYALSQCAGIPPDAALYFAYFGGACLAGSLAWFSVDPSFRPAFGRLVLNSAWRGSRYYGASSVLTTLHSLDVVIAGAVGGQHVAGAYGAVNRWTQPIGLSTNAFASLLAPVVAKAKGADDAWNSVRSSLWLPGLSILVALVMAALAELLVLLLMGPEFTDSIPVLRLLCVSAALSSASLVVLTVLQARGRERRVASIMAVGVVVLLAMVGPLVALYGALGVAIATLVEQSLLLVLLLLAARKAAVSFLKQSHQGEPGLRGPAN